MMDFFEILEKDWKYQIDFINVDFPEYRLEYYPQGGFVFLDCEKIMDKIPEILIFSQSWKIDPYQDY